MLVQDARPRAAAGSLPSPATGLAATEDPLVGWHRRRRVTELVSLGIGLAGLASTVFTWLLRGAMPPEMAVYAQVGIALFTPICVAICLVSAAALGLAETRWYPWLSGTRIALDVLIVLLVAAVMPDLSRGPLATLVAFPVVAAGLRQGLRRALLVWAVTVAGFVTLTVRSIPAADASGVELHKLVLLLACTGCLSLVIGWVIGSQTDAVDRHLASLEEARAGLHHQATHDALTGLANRAALYRQASSLSGPGALLVVDLDGFKSVNDVHGHAAGDTVLCVVAQRLRAAVRPDDLVVRMGGDEFLLLLPGADASAAERVAAALPALLSEPITTAAGSLAVGASIGVALARGDQEWSIDALSADADARMYAAKAGRNARSAGTPEPHRDQVLT